MALLIDYVLQNGYNFVGIFTKHEYPSEFKVWMEMVMDLNPNDDQLMIKWDKNHFLLQTNMKKRAGYI